MPEIRIHGWLRACICICICVSTAAVKAIEVRQWWPTAINHLMVFVAVLQVWCAISFPLICIKQFVSYWKVI